MTRHYQKKLFIFFTASLLGLYLIFHDVIKFQGEREIEIPPKPVTANDLKVTVLSDSTSNSTTTRPPNIPQFHLINSFFSAQSHEKYSNFSTDQQNKRNREYLEVLQSNLNHMCVAKIHLLYVRDEDIKLILSAKLTNRHKLHPVKWHRLLHMADFFLYASRNLINKSVIALNSDIALGEGFEQIKSDALLKLKHFYSLTRYETNVSCAIGYQMCSKSYKGSHDTHIFALSKPLNETRLLQRLDYPINMFQAENGLLYTMRKIFQFKVSNPCKVLKTYHHHCSVVHGPRPGNNYSIYTLGWTKKEVLSGLAWPCSL